MNVKNSLLPRLLAVAFFLHSFSSVSFGQLSPDYYEAYIVSQSFDSYDGVTTVDNGPGYTSLNTGLTSQLGFLTSNFVFAAAAGVTNASLGTAFEAGAVNFFNGTNLLGSAATRFNLSLGLQINGYSGLGPDRLRVLSSLVFTSTMFKYVSTPNSLDAEASRDYFGAKTDMGFAYFGGALENQPALFGLLVRIVPNPLAIISRNTRVVLANADPAFKVEFAGLTPLSSDAIVQVTTDLDQTNIREVLRFSSVPEPSVYGGAVVLMLVGYVTLKKRRRLQ